MSAPATPAAGSSGSLATLGQRPPRLALRVVLYSALLLGIGAATLLVFIRHFERDRAERAAMLEASVVTQTVVDRLHPGDLAEPLSPERRGQLDRLFAERVLDRETIAAALTTPDARLTYATRDAHISRLSKERLAEALRGVVVSESVSMTVGGETKRALRTYAPFRLGDGSAGVVVVDKDYAPIASAARNAAIAVAAVLEVILVFLWLCLIPVMRTATRRIHRQLDTIAHLALHDDLTGLPNRAWLGARLDELCGEEGPSAPFSVFFIDLDRFKDVNDTLGHERGNELLVEVSRRLEAVLDEREFVSRLGGDEFAVVSESAVDRSQALVLADRLRGAIAELFDVAGISIEPQASIGIALAPEHGRTREDLLRRADIAMYAAKRRGLPQVFAAEHDGHSTGRLAMTGELRLALERRELVVHYQPQFDLHRGDVRGVEALVRWRHPVHGLLEPRAFLEAVEQGGLTRRLTRYVLDESLRDLRAWREAGMNLALAVNVCARDLADVRFPDEIAEALARHGVDPSALELEITEDMLLTDSARARKRLEEIVEQGVRVAIDDFGVGYSSLGQLKNLPAQVLKVDQSFVAGMASDERDAAIVRSTIRLAHELGLEVVAEGIETLDHISQLRAAGCDAGQGYYLGRPVAADGHASFALGAGSLPEDGPGAEIVQLRRAG